MSDPDYLKHVEKTYDNYESIGKRLHEKFTDLRSAAPSYFDINVKRGGDAESYLTQLQDLSGPDAEKAGLDYWGYKPATVRFKDWADPAKRGNQANGARIGGSDSGLASTGLLGTAATTTAAIEFYRRRSEKRSRWRVQSTPSAESK